MIIMIIMIITAQETGCIGLMNHGATCYMNGPPAFCYINLLYYVCYITLLFCYIYILFCSIYQYIILTCYINWGHLLHERSPRLGESIRFYYISRDYMMIFMIYYVMLYYIILYYIILYFIILQYISRIVTSYNSYIISYSSHEPRAARSRKEGGLGHVMRVGRGIRRVIYIYIYMYMYM